MDIGWLAGPGRAVLPDLVGGIEFSGQHKSVLTAEAFQPVRFLGVIQPAIDGDDRVFLEHLL